jgi:GT2 family glycosyltransferase
VALIVRRDVFNEVGGFDEDYFLLREETDLCWRIRLRGYKVVFIPNSIVYHYVGGHYSSWWCW